MPCLPRFRRALLDRRAIGRKPKRHRSGQFGDRSFVPSALRPRPPTISAIRGAPGLEFRVEQHRPGVDLERPRAVGADARQRARARRLDQARVGRSVEPDGERPLDIDDARVRRTAAAAADDLHSACRLDLIGRGDRRRCGLVGGRARRRGPRTQPEGATSTFATANGSPPSGESRRASVTRPIAAASAAAPSAARPAARHRPTGGAAAAPDASPSGSFSSSHTAADVLRSPLEPANQACREPYSLAVACAALSAPMHRGRPGFDPALRAFR